MATLAEKIRCEMRMRELLQSEGMPPPDEVEYGYGCIRLFFNDPKVVLVVDIDDYTEVDDAIARRREFDLAEPADELRESRGPPFTSFPQPGPAQHN
jgi:hypothetical protein